MLVAVCGRRWTVEEDHEFGKDHFGFDAACPDRRRLRNANARYSDFLRAAGVGQRDGTAPQADYGLA